MTKSKQIFLLNAPPRSGKDSLADHLEKVVYASKKDKMALPLKAACKELFSLTDKEFHEFDNNTELKNAPQERFYGKSWRDINIMLSENFIKPNFDNAFFGRCLVERIKSSDKLHFFISDSGFVEEVAPLVKEFGAENVHLIQIQRDGCTFVGDSRNYVDPHDVGLQCAYGFINNGTLEEFFKEGEKFVEDLLTVNGLPFMRNRAIV